MSRPKLKATNFVNPAKAKRKFLPEIQIPMVEKIVEPTVIELPPARVKKDVTDLGAETAIQAARYRVLIDRIVDARRRRKRFVLIGAKQIALYLKKSEAFATWAFRQKLLPMEREGGRRALDVGLYLYWKHVKRISALHGLDFQQELKRRGAPPPNWWPPEEGSVDAED